MRPTHPVNSRSTPPTLPSSLNLFGLSALALPACCSLTLATHVRPPTHARLPAHTHTVVATFLLPFREPLWKGGGIVKDHKRIAKRYLQSWFFFDLVSTLPFDVMMTLFESNDEGSSESTTALRGTRLTRLVRLVRLFKLGRLIRAQRIVTRIIERLEGKSEMLTISFTVRTMLFCTCADREKAGCLQPDRTPHRRSLVPAFTMWQPAHSPPCGSHRAPQRLRRRT